MKLKKDIGNLPKRPTANEVAYKLFMQTGKISYYLFYRSLDGQLIKEQNLEKEIVR